MIEVINDTLLDIAKILPFLFTAFLIIEIIEHKLNKKTEKTIEKAGRFGPIAGSILGAIPQCGFSVLATNLYVTRIITLGTLFSIYLSTSDEMLLIMLAKKTNPLDILKIVTIKIVIGMAFGFIVDLFVKKKEKTNFKICESEHCHCDEHFVKSAIKHTLKTGFFILIITFLLNLAFYYIGEDYIKEAFNKNNLLTPFISGLIGLIPNCGASVIITELYLNNVLSLGQSISGLLTNSGVALIVLFKSNKNLKENIVIISVLYAVGVIFGLILELI